MEPLARNADPFRRSDLVDAITDGQLARVHDGRIDRGETGRARRVLVATDDHEDHPTNGEDGERDDEPPQRRCQQVPDAAQPAITRRPSVLAVDGAVAVHRRRASMRHRRRFRRKHASSRAPPAFPPPNRPTQHAEDDEHHDRRRDEFCLSGEDECDQQATQDERDPPVRDQPPGGAHQEQQGHERSDGTPQRLLTCPLHDIEVDLVRTRRERTRQEHGHRDRWDWPRPQRRGTALGSGFPSMGTQGTGRPDVGLLRRRDGPSGLVRDGSCRSVTTRHLEQLRPSVVGATIEGTDGHDDEAGRRAREVQRRMSAAMVAGQRSSRWAAAPVEAGGGAGRGGRGCGRAAAVPIAGAACHDPHGRRVGPPTEPRTSRPHTGPITRCDRHTDPPPGASHERPAPPHRPHQRRRHRGPRPQGAGRPACRRRRHRRPRGHAAKPRWVAPADDTDAEGHAVRPRGIDTADDTEGHAKIGRVQPAESADAEGHAADRA